MKINFKELSDYLIEKRDSYMLIANRLHQAKVSENRIEHFKAKAAGINEVLLHLEYLHFKQGEHHES